MDAYGNTVRMTGVNWMDFEATRTLAEQSGFPLHGHVKTLAARGANVLRVPLTVELVHDWINGSDSIAVLTELLDASQAHGVKIILSMNGVEGGKDSHLHPVWFTDQFTTEDFIRAWLWLAEQYRKNDTIVAFDLMRQPHGWKDQLPEDNRVQPSPSIYACWGNPLGLADDAAVCPNHLNWPYVAGMLADEIHSSHPDILIIVAGVESHQSAGTPSATPEYGLYWRGGNLSGVNEHPLSISRPDKLLYSTVMTGPALEPDRGWFRNPEGEYDFNYSAIYNRKWKYAFGFIIEQQIAPVFVGEWGSITDTGDLDGQFSDQYALVNDNIQWLDAVAVLNDTFEVSHTGWTYNLKSTTVGGLLNDNWNEWDITKLDRFQSTLWKVEGAHVGLDHRVNLFNGTNIANVAGIDPAVDRPVMR